MECSVNLHTMKSGWPIVYVEESQVIISKNISFLSLKIDLVCKASISLGCEQFATILSLI